MKKILNRKVVFAILILISITLILLGLWFMTPSKEPKKDPEPSPTMDEPIVDGEITKDDFTLYKDSGIEKSVIIIYENNTSHVYMLITNHDNTPFELNNFTIDLFSPNQEYITSKKFGSYTLDGKDSHLFDWEIEMEHVEISQVTFHISN